MIGKTVTEGGFLGFRKVREYLHRHFLPKKYVFRSIVPSEPFVYQALPHSEWEIGRLCLIHRKK